VNRPTWCFELGIVFWVLCLSSWFYMEPGESRIVLVLLFAVLGSQHGLLGNILELKEKP